MKTQALFMSIHNLTDLEIQRYFQNEPRFNGAYSRDILLDKIKDEAYVTIFDEYADIGTHWIPLDSNGNIVTYFDSFGVDHIPKEIKISSMDLSIFRIQAYDSVMCGYFCVGFITDQFLPSSFQENHKMILNYIKHG